MTETASGSSADRTQPRHRPDRVALWSSLLVVHSLLLAAAYHWIVVTGDWTDGSGRAFAVCAFVGVLSAMLNATSSLAHSHETGIFWRGHGSRPELTRQRAMAWVVLEITSLSMLSFCAAIVVYRILNAG